ncbi:MAG: 4Fe-4S ferredoxin, partial [Anaerolineae bacterium]|nr:4Fe-4S ferredoxin [Anaerolineae bacterium]
KNHFWAGAIGLGHILPLLLVIAAAFSAGAAPLLVAAAAVLTVIGLYLFEYAFVMAPQEVPNS